MSVTTAVAMLSMAACGGGGAADGDRPTGGSQQTGTRVEVTENDFTIALSPSQLEPGTYTFAVVNEGTVGHDLVIDGPGVDRAQTRVISAGQQDTLTVTLREGTYELWCSVGNHREQGMALSVSVGGGAGSTGGNGY